MDKLTFRQKIGYSSAAVGDAVSYMFVTTFILFFLTTVAGLQPAIAGTLTAIGSIWDAVVNPIFGYLSDHARTKMGRRRPFMLGFCVPLFIVIVMLYTSVEFSYALKVVYYGFMVLAFWTAFTGFFVPYYALGAEYTQNYEERTLLRSYASFFNMIGTLFSMAMPPLMVEWFADAGMSTSRAWQVTAVFLAALTVASIIITVVISKDKDICEQKQSEPSDSDEAEERVGIADMFREYIQVLSLGPMKWLLATSLFYLIAYELIMSDFVYFMTYNLGFGGTGVSAGMVARCILCMAFIPVASKLCSMLDKRTGQLIVIAFGGAGLVAMRFVFLDNTVWLIVFIFFAAITTQTYWQIMPAIFYDVCEYDEYETGNRREGAILSVQGLVEAAASGLGAQILGLILQFAGFDGTAAVQTQTAQQWILNCTTWVPVIFLLLAGFALYKFPITRKVYNDIVDKLEERKNGN